MASRIEIELTSDRGDGTWTWRAAGAKNPKGILDGSVLPSGASVGDVLTAEADYGIDGIDVVSVHQPKAKERNEAATIEVIGSKRNEQLVTTRLAKSEGRGRGRGRGERRGSGDGFGRGRDGAGRGRDGAGRGRDGSGRDGGGRGGERRRERIRPQHFNREAMVDVLPEEQRGQARTFLESGETGNLPEPVVESLKAADWRDRADAALAGVDKLDLRDLRPVVATSVTAAASEDAKALAQTLQAKINARVDKEQQTWMADLNTALSEKRAIRALRQAARPVRLGVPLPDHVAKTLVDVANEAFEPDLDAERWGALLDAVAFSPVRPYVVPANMPEDPNDKELVAAVTKLADRVPQIAAMFGIVAPAKRDKAKKPKADKAKADRPKPDTTKSDTAAAGAATVDKGKAAPVDKGKAAPVDKGEAAPVDSDKPEDTDQSATPADETANAQTDTGAGSDDVILEDGEVIITEESEDTPAEVRAVTDDSEQE